MFPTRSTHNDTTIVRPLPETLPSRPLPEPPLAPLDKAAIETWCLANPERALQLGKRLMKLKGREDLAGLQTLGEFEDRATEWALENQMPARLLFLKLMPRILAATGTTP